MKKIKTSINILYILNLKKAIIDLYKQVKFTNNKKNICLDI